jgi:hypothetical protein
MKAKFPDPSVARRRAPLRLHPAVLSIKSGRPGFLAAAADGRVRAGDCASSASIDAAREFSPLGSEVRCSAEAVQKINGDLHLLRRVSQLPPQVSYVHMSVLAE